MTTITTSNFKRHIPGALLCLAIAAVATALNLVLPIDLIGTALVALLIGMALSPLVSRHTTFQPGVDWSAKRILRTGIILAGITLSFAQVFEVGRYALILMVFTITTAFGVGYLARRFFGLNWKLGNLLSISTAICGGTAVATLGPVIEAEDRDIAYAISATFIFDLITVIAFPWIGTLIGLSDAGYGLWAGTSVNDTSSVIAAGYAFSDVAGSLATIVKLTRTLFIVPIVLAFSWIYARRKQRASQPGTRVKVRIVEIFPWFVLGFLGFVALRSTGWLSAGAVTNIGSLSKFFLATALGAIGLKTSFKEVTGLGFKPMIAAVVIDTSVVIVALIAQYFLVG